MKIKVLKQLAVMMCALFVMAACGNRSNNFPPAENSLDAAREFIDGYLKGDFEKARFYMEKDADNLQNLEKMEKAYNSKNKADKQQYQQASIIIEGIEAVNDSTDIINYKNSFDKIARKVKVVKAPDGWQVDFKYTLSGNI